MNPIEEFFALLKNHFSEYRHFWSSGGLDLKTVDRTLAELPTREAIALKCLLTIWSGNDNDGKYAVDISDLAILSPDKKEPLIQWLTTPFWP